MERALKSFLDGVSEDDNVVNLDQDVKNEAEPGPPAEKEKIEATASGSKSGMLDMRAMAQRYQEMSSSPAAKAAVKVPEEEPLAGQMLSSRLVAPIVGPDVEEPSKAPMIAAAAAALLLTVVVTAGVTAIFVKRSMTAEINALKAQQTQQTVVVAATPPAVEEAVVAEWPEPNAAVLAATVATEEIEPSMDFAETEVQSLGKTRSPVSEPSSVARGTAAAVAEAAAVAAVAEASSIKPEALPPEPEPEPEPAVATAVGGEPCDEVLCLVEGRGCCGEAKKVAAAAAAEVDPGLPVRLERGDINAGITKVKGRLGSCGSRFEVSGIVTLKLKISPEGKVVKDNANKGEAEFHACLSKMLKKARFTKTQEGATVSYPVILH